ncbi:MAG: YihY/virulence factor BrkB family protein [Xanthomonadaceae bacterium]|nr:YihY/virulence factor BrkB family protein [Xanthomonadaceae bacterium]
MATRVHSGDEHFEEAHGRHAERPGDIPKRGWLDIAMRVKAEVSKDNVSLIAAGLALYALLAIFPALTAAVSIYGLFASPQQMADHLQSFQGVMPGQATQILEGQMQTLAQQRQTLSIGLVFGVLLALWSARKGMVAIMAATNVAYDEREERGFFKQILVSLAFTLGAVLAFLLVVLLVVAVPIALELVPLGDFAQTVIMVVRWALLWLIAVFGMAIVYRFAPDRHEPKWKWLSWGSAIAATLWLVGSLLFAIYARSSASYGETYGALGGVVVLLLWFYLTGYSLVLGAEINSEMERQTKEDTTSGPRKPMGEREAHAADTVGEMRQ